MQSCSRIKDENASLVLGVAEGRRTWKTYFEDLYTQD